MKIMNTTNYSTQKQNQPNFGMVLDFTPEAIKTIGKRNFQRLAREVEDLITKDGGLELTVKGSTKGVGKGELSLSADEETTKAQNSCMYQDVKAYLHKFNDFFSPLT